MGVILLFDYYYLMRAKGIATKNISAKLSTDIYK